MARRRSPGYGTLRPNMGDVMTERKSVARLVQDAIDRGATTVEEIHKTIADLPLKILEERELLRGPAKQVRRVQDQTIGAVYGLIREVNRQVGNLATDLLNRRGPGAERKRQGGSADH